MKTLKHLAIVALLCYGASTVAGYDYPWNEPGLSEEQKQELIEEFVTGKKAKEEERKKIIAQEIARNAEESSYAKRKEEAVKLLRALIDYTYTSKFSALKTETDIKYFGASLFTFLDRVEGYVKNIENEKAILREIAEAKSHIESHTTFNSKEERKQFLFRMRKFAMDIEGLITKY